MSDELNQMYARILRLAGGDPDKACMLAYRFWDCGPELMELIHRDIRKMAAANYTSPKPTRH